MLSAFHLVPLVLTLFSAQALAALHVTPQGQPMSCQPFAFQVGGGQPPYTITIQIINGEVNPPYQTIGVSQDSNAGWYCDQAPGSTFSVTVTDASGNSASAPDHLITGGIENGSTGSANCAGSVMNNPNHPAPAPQPIPSSQSNTPVTTQVVVPQIQSTSQVVAPQAQSPVAQSSVAQTQQTPTSTLGAGNAGVGAGMITITTPQAAPAPAPTVAPDSLDLSGDLVPTVCLTPCNAYLAATATCLGIDPATLDDNVFNPNSTESSCICTNSVATNVATCGTCIAQNPDSATTHLNPEHALNALNSICTSWSQSSNGQNTWTNATFAYSGGLNGQGASIPGGSNVISKISAGAISVYGDVTGFGVGVGSKAGALGKSVYGDATAEVGKVTAGVAAAGQAAASGLKGVGNAIGSIFSASPKLEISIFLPVATTVICLGIFGGAALVV